MPAEPEPETEPPEPVGSGEVPEPLDAQEHGSTRSREPSSDYGTEPESEPEPLFVTPQLPPAFVLNELDTSLFVVDEPDSLRVCDDQFKVSCSRRHRQTLRANTIVLTLRKI